MYPHERSLVKRLDGKPFALLGVNSDEDKDKLQQVMEKEQITWRSWWDGGNTDGPIQTSYNISHWPTLYLIDAKGVIRHIDLREEKQLDEAIDQLLGEQEADKNANRSRERRRGPWIGSATLCRLGRSPGWGRCASGMEAADGALAALHSFPTARQSSRRLPKGVPSNSGKSRPGAGFAPSVPMSSTSAASPCRETGSAWP